MAAPTPVAETYVPCETSTFTIGSGVDTSVMKIIQGGLTLEYGVDDMTNSGSGGAYEDVKTLDKASGSFTAAIVSGSMPTPQHGQIFHVVIANPTGPTFTANFRFNAFKWNILNVKEGLKVEFTLTSQGPITIA